MRRVLVDEDLSGQILEGPAKQSLLLRCRLIGASIRGDWRGSDLIDCRADGADLSSMDSYACYWRGGSWNNVKWPKQIGSLHHIPVADIIRSGLSTLTPAQRRIGEKIPDWVLSDVTFASWDTAWGALIGNLPGATKPLFVDILRRTCAGFPALLDRIDHLEAALVRGEEPLWDGRSPQMTTVRWPDGAAVSFDPLSLPALAEPSRFALARWLEGQADIQRPEQPHHAFVYSILPPIALPMATADHWHQDVGRRDGL